MKQANWKTIETTRNKLRLWTDKSSSKSTCIGINPISTEVKKAITNNWKLLLINQEFKDMFQEPPILAFIRAKNLYHLLGCKNIVDGKLQGQSRKKMDFPLTVSQTYVVSKFYTSSLLQTVWHKKHIIFPMTLSVRVNYWYTLWNVESTVSNTSANQKENLILDWIIIVRTFIDKTHHKQISTSIYLVTTSVNMPNLPWLDN